MIGKKTKYPSVTTYMSVSNGASTFNDFPINATVELFLVNPLPSAEWASNPATAGFASQYRNVKLSSRKFVATL